MRRSRLRVDDLAGHGFVAGGRPGLVDAVFQATPQMTAGYILVGIGFEERDLIAQFGHRDRAYRERVGRLLPYRAGGWDRTGVAPE